MESYLLLKNSNLAYLKSIPKTIILVFNSEEKVVETMPKEKQKKMKYHQYLHY